MDHQWIKPGSLVELWRGRETNSWKVALVLGICDPNSKPKPHVILRLFDEEEVVPNSHKSSNSLNLKLFDEGEEVAVGSIDSHPHPETDLKSKFMDDFMDDLKLKLMVDGEGGGRKESSDVEFPVELVRPLQPSPLKGVFYCWDEVDVMIGDGLWSPGRITRMNKNRTALIIYRYDTRSFIIKSIDRIRHVQVTKDSRIEYLIGSTWYEAVVGSMNEEDQVTVDVVGFNVRIDICDPFLRLRKSWVTNNNTWRLYGEDEPDDYLQAASNLVAESDMEEASLWDSHTLGYTYSVSPNKEECNITLSDEKFSKDLCPSLTKKLDVEPIDEVAIQNLQTFKEKKFVDISRADLELG